MKYLITAVLTTILLLCTNGAHAQLSGKWYGIAMPMNTTTSNGYLCEFLLQQKGNVVTGTFNYYFRNGYLSNKIKGVYDPKTRKLRTKDIPIIYHGTKDVSVGIDCSMQGEFTLMASQVETSLSGYFIADENHSLTCMPLKIRFIKQLKEDTKLEDFVDEEAPKPVPVVPPKPIEKTPEEIREENKKVELKTRINEVVNELEVSDDSVRIQFFDNGIVDKDSISVFYSNKLVVYKEMLSDRKAITIQVHIDSLATNNEHIMFAENLGDTPPNSALMIISDSKHKYEVYLTSNFQKNATIRLRKEAPKNPNAL